MYHIFLHFAYIYHCELLKSECNEKVFKVVVYCSTYASLFLLGIATRNYI
jgi:hypothetical protein